MRKGKTSGGRSSSNSNNSNGFLPNSLRIITSCLKTVTNNASNVASSVKSAGVSVASTISSVSDDHKEQVTWAGFDKLELGSSVCKCVLLLGYQNGFQVLDVDDASNFSELVSRRDDGPVTFLQMQPFPLNSKSHEGFRKSFPLLLAVGGDDNICSTQVQGWGHLSGNNENDKHPESHAGNSGNCSRVVRFYSLRSHGYVHTLRFRSAVCMVRCSPRVVAVGLATQIYCFDALTLENKFSVLTYPVPQVGGQGKAGVNIGYGPLAVGPRWLAYASNEPLSVTTGRLNPQTLSPLGVSPSTSPASGTGLMAHYAMESGKHLAAGIVHLGDRGYKNLSKYCQELLPENSNSSLSLNTGTRAGRSETDAAGVVVVRDFLSRAVICKFRAHTTPISALCFDPSGTLLVTASIYGNSINIFRIMPSRNHSGADSQSFDWSSSYVHLYKFHRGIRAVVIQDICFSSYSQWIAVVSSKGTCHVFALSPFGGDVGFQNLNTQSEEISIAPVQTPPWWSASSCTSNLLSALPPPPVTISVATRIKDNNSGLLNTVSNAAASVSGKVSVPSGALAAAFHNSIPCTRRVQVPITYMEHLLVYTPSGHVVQHQIQPSFGVESDGDSRPYSSSFMQSQDGEPSINIRPVQWWDVCRRSNWPEREDYISETLVCKERASIVSDNSISATYEEYSPQLNTSAAISNSMRVDQDRFQWYLSNAEVQYSKRRMPVWQNAKIAFCMNGSLLVDDGNGEHEIEKFPVYQIEFKQKHLLPVFDHFHSMRSALNDRGISGARYSNAFSLEPPHANKDKSSEETIICHSKPASFSSTESSDGGTSARMENLLEMDHLNYDQSYIPGNLNSNDYCEKKTTNMFGELSLSHNKLAAIVAEKQAPETKLHTVVDCEVPVPSEISCPNQPLRLNARDNDVSNMEFSSMDSENGKSDQNEENFHMFAFFEVDGKKTEPTETLEVIEADDSPVLNSDSSKVVDLKQEGQDIIGDLFDFPEKCGESPKPVIGQKEEEDMVEGLFALFDDGPKTVEQTAETVNVAAVFCSSNTGKDNCNQEEDEEEEKEEEDDDDDDEEEEEEEDGMFALFGETM